MLQNMDYSLFGCMCHIYVEFYSISSTRMKMKLTSNK